VTFSIINTNDDEINNPSHLVAMILDKYEQAIEPVERDVGVD